MDRNVLFQVKLTMEIDIALQTKGIVTGQGG